jgi:hypothetical protein
LLHRQPSSGACGHEYHADAVFTMGGIDAFVTATAAI